jgi:hypothetical protein
MMLRLMKMKRAVVRAMKIIAMGKCMHLPGDYREKKVDQDQESKDSSDGLHIPNIDNLRTDVYAVAPSMCIIGDLLVLTCGKAIH